MFSARRTPGLSLTLPSTLLVVVLVVALAPRSRADTVTIEPSLDNTLYESSTGALSNGKGQESFCGRRSQSTARFRRTLVKFDIASVVPAGSQINAVTLKLHVSRARAGAQSVALRSVLKDWGEGTSDASGQEGGGASSTPGDATWVHTFFPTTFWTSPGGDFSATISATTSVDSNGFYTWGPTAEMAADVQGWLDAPATNFGWVLIGNEASSSTAKRFDSRENGVAGNRPKLTIDFCPPATWSNYGTGLAGTLGVPALTSSNPPVLCTTLTMSIGNSRGVSTPAVIFLGVVKADIPTAFVGHLLLLPTNIFSLQLPAAGASIPFNVICDEAFCGVSIYMQVLEIDPGAIRGVSFTRGIDFDHGV